MLLGTDRTLGLVPKSKAERHTITSDLNQLVATIEKAADKRVVLLIYGDPMFYGLARYVCDKLGKERFVVVPHVSSMQLAFARVMETWEEAYLTDLAKHPLDAVLEKIRTAQKVGLFTTDHCGPAEVAKALLDRRIDYFTAYVCENLGARDERVTRGTLAEIAKKTFDPLNVMILIRDPDAPDRPREAVGRRLFGNPDEAFLQSKPKLGLLTPAEVRAIALAQMDIAPSSIVWDIGAGSGSVSVEAAQMASRRRGLRDRNGCRGPRPHPPERRAVQRGECERRPRPRPGNLRRAARSRLRVRRRRRPRSHAHFASRLYAASARVAGWS